LKAKWVPAVIEELCTGCGLCVEACGPQCLELENRVATLPRPNDCGSEEHCIAGCPEDAIHMRWVPMDGNHEFGVWRESEGSEPHPPSTNKDFTPAKRHGVKIATPSRTNL